MPWRYIRCSVCSTRLRRWRIRGRLPRTVNCTSCYLPFDPSAPGIVVETAERAPKKR